MHNVFFKTFYHVAKKKAFGRDLKAKYLLLLQDAEARRLSERHGDGFAPLSHAIPSFNL